MATDSDHGTFLLGIPFDVAGAGHVNYYVISKLDFDDGLSYLVALGHWRKMARFSVQHSFIIRHMSYLMSGRSPICSPQPKAAIREYQIAVKTGGCTFREKAETFPRGYSAGLRFEGMGMDAVKNARGKMGGAYFVHLRP